MKRLGKTAVGAGIVTVVVVLFAGAIIAAHFIKQPAQNPSATAVGRLQAQSAQSVAPQSAATATAAPSTPAPPCTDPSQLHLTIAHVGSGMQQNWYSGTITNSGQPCTLSGYPVLIERNSGGTAVPAIEMSQYPGVPVATVTLAQGAPASFFADVAACSVVNPPLGGGYSLQVDVERAISSTRQVNARP